MSNPIIAAQNITFGYTRDKATLSGINLSIPTGARVAFVGPNGAGKSTLFLLLNGILRPTEGTLLYQQKPYDYSTRAIDELRRRVGFVFQDHDAQLFAGSVIDDVIFGPMNQGLNTKEAEQRARLALQEVAMLEYADSPIHFLSHGQKKRVAIAGVLAMDPDVIVMDEPTAGLDFHGIQSLTRIMGRLHQQGKTFIVSTHDIDWAWAWADIVYVMDKGQIVTTGAPAEILNLETHEQMGFARSIIGTVWACVEKNMKEHVPRTLTELVARLSNFGHKT